MLRSLTGKLDAGVLAVGVSLAVVVVAAGGLTVALWRYQTFTNAAEVAVLKVKLNGEIARSRVMENSVRNELTGIYLTLYTAPEAPEATLRKPSVVEAWQVNRDKELRARIRQLEDYRQAVDAILRRLGERPPTIPPWRDPQGKNSK